MKNKAGIVCMLLGTALIFGALFLFLHNENEDAQAESTRLQLMPQLVEIIEENAQENPEPPTYEQPIGTPIEYLDPSAFVMTEVKINGYSYIGYLSIPKLGLELPVMSTWSYAKLNIAPCRYTGSIRGEDLVIMAHNYSSHFGKLSRTELGDQVQFTDVDGNVVVYEIVGKDVLMPTAVEEMIAGDFDLTLFTCTYGGKNRVTVYCDRVQ